MRGGKQAIAIRLRAVSLYSDAPELLKIGDGAADATPHPSVAHDAAFRCARSQLRDVRHLMPRSVAQLRQTISRGVCR